MRNNLPIIVGIALPITFIAVLSAVLFIPSLFVDPQHDFLFVNESNGYYGYDQSYENSYTVEDGRIQLEPVSLSTPTPAEVTETPREEAPTLYRYDIGSHTTHEITLEEVQEFSFDPGPSSPDGYMVQYRNGHSGIFELFGSSGNANGYVVSRGGGEERLTGLSGGSYYGGRGEFELIGWIE